MAKQLTLNLQPAVVLGETYLVVKELDIDRYLNTSQATMLRFLRDVVADQRQQRGVSEFKCLVIEHNHPTPQPGPQALEGLLVEAIKQVGKV